MAERAALAAPLLLQSPPGQVANVYEDLAGLVGSEGNTARADEEEFKKLSAKVREEHNLQQHIVVDLPDGNGKSILCASAAHPSGSGRFLAPRQEVTFHVDHETLATSDSKPNKSNKQVESFRSHLEKLLSVYIEDRYETGLVGVFAVPLPRVEVTVNQQTVEDAKKTEKEEATNSVEGTRIATTEPDEVTNGQTEQADENMEGDEHEKDNRESEGEQIQTDDAEEKTGDEVMEDVHDDPVETAKVMEEVENDPEPTPAVMEDDMETEGETKIVIHIVANRYKLSNYWTGRWVSTYTLSSPTASQIDGQVNVLIHYFEEGNVQLNSNKSDQLSISNESTEEAKIKAIAKAIEIFESKYQEELFNTCNELGDGAFRSLRRQLPMTKQKMDWDRVLNYNIGSELGE